MQGGRQALWEALLAQEDRARRVARARSGSRHDVDDLVQEGMARVAAMPEVDLERVGPLLTTVVMNLAVDGHRRDSQANRLRRRVAGRREVQGSVEEEVCDDHEARWLHGQVQGLSGQDRRAVELRAAGLTLPEIADELGVTYRAAEGALGRARTRLRRAWAATAALLWPFALGRARRLSVLAGPPTAAAALVAVVILTTGSAPHAAAGTPPQTPAGPAPHDAHAAERGTAGPTPQTRSATATPSPTAVTGRGRPGPATARPAPAATPGSQSVATTPPLRVGDAHAGPATVDRARPDEPFLDTVRRCLRDGLSTDPQGLGCRE